MIPRAAEPLLQELLKGFPIVTITGPRQSGKTTLARKTFEDKPCRSLEDPDVRRMALEDPRAFLRELRDGGVIDEVQRAPELLSYLQTQVDEDGRMGLFLLTGSQQFGLLSGVTQSLAGRSGFVELLPFSLSELSASRAPRELDDRLLMGGYPPLHDRKLSPRTWFPAYVTAYVERDVRQLLNIKDLETFQRFVRLCAGRSGQLLNLSSLATDCAISHNTAKAWLSVLEASYLVFFLRPHHASFNKRLIKSPKLYFHDTGLLCWLLGLRTEEHLAVHPLRGAIFETFVVSEIIKQRLNSGEQGGAYFWRDSNGNEIDVIIEVGGKLMPIEIKSGLTINPDFFKSLRRWLALAKKEATSPTLIHAGTGALEHRGVRVYGWDCANQAAEPQ